MDSKGQDYANLILTLILTITAVADLEFFEGGGQVHVFFRDQIWPWVGLGRVRN